MPFLRRAFTQTTLLSVAGALLLFRGCGGAHPQGTLLPRATQPTVAPAVMPASGRPFAATSPFNTPTAGGTRWTDNSVLHPSAALNLVWWANRTSAAVYYGAASDPVWTVTIPGLSDPALNRNHPTQVVNIHAPAGMTAGTDSDHILVLIDKTTNAYYEFWLAQINAGAHTVTGAQGASGNIVSGPGAGTVGNNDGVRAANFSWAAGLITGRDLNQGKIDHAMVVGMPQQILNSGCKCYVAPATAYDTGWAYGPIKMGTKIGIPAGTARPAGMTATGNMIFDTLVNYGAYVGDFVGGPFPVFYLDRNTTSDANTDQFLLPQNGNSTSDMAKMEPLLRYIAA